MRLAMRESHPRGPIMGQFYIQIIGNNRIQPDEEAGSEARKVH